MESCVFCKIVRQDIPAHPLYESEKILAFADLNPQAPVHLLIIPKTHYAQLGEVPEAEMGLLAEMVQAARQLAAEKGLSEKGYRLAMNVNPEGGQTVFHIHLHLLGGQQMGPSLVG